MSNNRYLYHLYNYGNVVNFWGVLARLDGSYRSNELMITTTEQHIEHLRSLQTLDEIGQYLFHLLANRSQPDSDFLNEMIFFMRRKKHLDHYIIRLFHLARAANLANTDTYHAMMEALQHSRKLNARTAVSLLDEAISKNLVDTKMYNRALSCINKSHDPDVLEALRIFKSAKQFGCADEKGYDMLLEIIAKQSESDEYDYHVDADEIFFGIYEIPELVALKNHLQSRKAKQESQPIQLTKSVLPVFPDSPHVANHSATKSVCGLGLFSKIIATSAVVAATAALLLNY